MFLNILRLRQKAAKRPEEKIKPDLPAKLFVIEYTFDDFYEDVVNHRKDNFIYTFEKLAKGEIDQKESEKLLGELNISKSQIPKIFSTDPGLPEGCEVGDIIKIERKEGSKINVYFRVVV